jgi:hypothetical protein
MLSVLLPSLLQRFSLTFCFPTQGSSGPKSFLCSVSNSIHCRGLRIYSSVQDVSPLYRWYIHLSSYVLVSGLYSIPRISIQSTCLLAIALARRLASSLSIMPLKFCSICTMPDALCLLLIHPWGTRFALFRALMLEFVECIPMCVVEPHEQSRGLSGSET